ncbi:hypothetical protein AVEN_29240-1 [Araneus ventricosus]|uniref:Uncharacterized protein n=1 Tax=Araneus ventricosus TaxID=182803 RepID=A0A4Y2E1R3_ARAVE|nr:hypothetical protein AVEN_29240-1 [Araneus ventricosus]
MSTVSVLVPVMAVCLLEGGQVRARNQAAYSVDSRCTLVVIPRNLTVNLYVRRVTEPVVLTFFITIPGVFSNKITLVPLPLLLLNLLYRVSTCCLGLRDHQIFLPPITYGILLDDKSSAIHNQHGL